MNRTYLGDSVYAEASTYEPDAIVLTTHNGYADDPRNMIYLEPEVITALIAYIRENTEIPTL